MLAHFDLGVYLLASVIFFIDLLDVLLRVYLRYEQTVPGRRGAAAATSVPLDIGEFTPYEIGLHLRPYAIVVSVHNLEAGRLDEFLAGMQPYRNRLWLIDDASTDDTWNRLQRAGVRAIRGEINRQKPAAIKALVAALPPDIATVIVLDPDARIVSALADVEKVLFEFQRSGMAAACPRVAIKPSGLLGRFQALEYSLSFSLGRKSLADFSITSGIALYRRDALERVLDRHSLSVYAEDLENSVILLLQNEQVYYDGRLVVETEGMRTVRGLFSQRVGWSFGLIKVYAERWRDLLPQARRGAAFTYQYFVYMAVFVLLFHPLKLVGLAVLAVSGVNCVDDLARLDVIADSSLTNPVYFLAVYVKYTALMLAAIPLAVQRTDRRYVLPIVPLYVFYAIGQIIPATVGYLNWFAVRFWGRRVYQDHYQPVAP